MKKYKDKIIEIIILSILGLSVLGILFIFTSDYLADAFMARAIPLSIIIGMSLVALAIYEKNSL